MDVDLFIHHMRPWPTPESSRSSENRATENARILWESTGWNSEPTLLMDFDEFRACLLQPQTVRQFAQVETQTYTLENVNLFAAAPAQQKEDTFGSWMTRCACDTCLYYIYIYVCYQSI